MTDSIAHRAPPLHDAFSAPAGSPHAIAPADDSPFSTRRIVPLTHSFHQHPAMRIDALRALAKRLEPTGRCRFIRPGAKVDSEFWHDPISPDGRDVDAVFDRLADPGSWIALYNIEADPAYERFLDEVIDSVRVHVEREQPGIFNVSGFVFISAPPSVTPFHIDRENNFWLQIAGRKRLQVWAPHDRRVVSEKSVEAFVISGDLDAVRLTETARTLGHVAEVRAGEGMYWPATSPHMTSTTAEWVRDDDAISISIGVCFYTRETRFRARVHQANRLLRAVGVAPTAPGQSAWRDHLKAPLGYAAAIARARLKGRTPPPGSY